MHAPDQLNPATDELLDADGVFVLSLQRLRPERILRAIADGSLPSETREGRVLVRRSNAQKWISTHFGGASAPK